MPRRALYLRLAFAVLVAAVSSLGLMLWLGVEPPAVAEAGPAVAEDWGEPEASPAPNFPVAVDRRIKFEDSPRGGVDEQSPYRTFEIDGPSGEKQYLTVTYLDEPDWRADRHDDRALITRLFDLNAAFSQAASYKLAKNAHWESIRVHVGDFAQDYCGDVTAVYSFRSAKIFAVMALGPNEVDFSASQCPLSRKQYEVAKTKEGREPTDDAFCSIRSACLKAFYDQPENRKSLRLPWLESAANVGLR